MKITINGTEFIIDQKFANEIKMAKKESRLAHVGGYFVDDKIYVEDVEIEPYKVAVEGYRKGTKVYNRTHGFPYSTVKKAVKTLNKYRVSVEECFDGNPYRMNSSTDNWLSSMEYEENKKLIDDILWAIEALQWAGFQDPETVLAYDAPVRAYRM